MNQLANDETLSIAQRAEFERWCSVRQQTKRRLIRTITIGFCYLLASLAVGAYLLTAIMELSRETIEFNGWYDQVVDMQWLRSVLWGYGALALIATVGYVMLLLLIWDLIPAIMYPYLAATPWVGPTARMVTIGVFCQSLYRSVLAYKTYPQAFEQAAQSAPSAAYKRWSSWASERLNAGHTPGNVLVTAPILDQPLFAAAAFISDDLSAADTIHIWHRATEESHLLMQSRLERAVLFLSITCTLASVFIASLALFLTSNLMRSAIQGYLIY